MANKVFANSREIACKAGAGKTICAFPDVCFTPPDKVPPTPPGIPIPYPNTGMASDTSKGSKKVQISGKEIALKNKSHFKKSSGDEAGCAQKKGVITSKNTGKVFFQAWSMDVKIEGQNAARHLDITTNNHGSTPGDTPPWPFIDGVAPPSKSDCVKAFKAARRLADKVRSLPKKDRPNKVSVLISPNGRIAVGRNQGGVSNALVNDVLKKIPPNRFNGSCAEVSCVSRALNKGIDVRGAVVATVHVRGPNSKPPSKHGHKDDACSVCNPLLKKFGIKEC